MPTIIIGQNHKEASSTKIVFTVSLTEVMISLASDNNENIQKSPLIKLIAKVV